jgi:tetratricopeptide (TPR) repeat protein
MLAGLYLNLAVLSDSREKQSYLEKATSKYNEADTIDMQEEASWLGKGILLLARKEVDRAIFQFNTLLERNPEHMPSLLGKVV